MSLMAANEESDPSAILNGFWVTLGVFYYELAEADGAAPVGTILPSRR